jgi:hypothetical protein
VGECSLEVRSFSYVTALFVRAHCLFYQPERVIIWIVCTLWEVLSKQMNCFGATPDTSEVLVPAKLLGKGAELEAKDKYGMTPLSRAAEQYYDISRMGFNFQ